MAPPKAYWGARAMPQLRDEAAQHRRRVSEIASPLNPHRETRDEAREKVDICINSMSGDLCTISAHRSMTVQDVKAAIKRKTGLSISEQTLVADTQKLLNHVRLADLPPGDSIQLTLVRLILKLR